MSTYISAITYLNFPQITKGLTWRLGVGCRSTSNFILQFICVVLSVTYIIKTEQNKSRKVYQKLENTYLPNALRTPFSLNAVTMGESKNLLL
jgi:hypothetical protein